MYGSSKKNLNMTKNKKMESYILYLFMVSRKNKWQQWKYFWKRFNKKIAVMTLLRLHLNSNQIINAKGMKSWLNRMHKVKNE